MRSLTTPDIYVAGDSAALPASYQPYVVMGCKTAMPEAFQVAENLLGELRGESPLPLHFSYTATCVSLGRNDGLVQFLKPDGEAANLVVRGRNAALLKELICRLTVWTLQLERHFNFYDLLMPKRQGQASPEAQPVPSQGI
jgi:NADH:ubiquinone reductase (H+-translocating)